MVVRLFLSKVVRDAFSMSSALRSLASRFHFSRSFKKLGSSFALVSDLVDSRQIDIIKCFSTASNVQFGCARHYYKLLIGNLPENANEELICGHFSRFGMVLSVKVVRDVETMKSRRHAYLVFSDKEALDASMSSGPHVISNRIVTLLPVKEMNFIAYDVSPSTTQESLHAYFSRYGKVFNCHVRNSVKGNRLGFVHYHSESNVDQELASKVHVIDGKQVKIQRMCPKELTQCVGNLSSSTTDESLAAYYSQFGKLLRAEVTKDEWTGESRGFGYITFSSQQEFDNALLSVPHIIDGREVKHEYATHEFTLFVAELPPSTSEQFLKQYFQQFGPVYECKIARDKQANQLRDFGWVTFSSLQGLNGALASRPHTIDGKRIEVIRNEKNIGKACTLFVGGLSPRTTDEMLYAVFSKFGSIVSCCVKYRKSGESRGFGYVSYSSLDEVSKALLVCTHVVDDRVVTVVSRKHHNSKFLQN